MYATGPHIFEHGMILIRLSDGVPARVTGASVLRAVVRTRETFSERLVIEQGDPEWMVAECFWPE